MINLHLLQSPQAVVDTGLDLEYVEVLVEQGDGRQETFAMQAVRVKHVRRMVWRSSRQ